jgi:ATPase subunit of ABC transporter with duplicated ATPase domains
MVVIKKITTKSFANLSELTYKVGSGQIFGRSGEGKTNLLTAITACFLNTGLDGKKIIPLPDDAKAGWVRIEYELDGEHKEAYRSWIRTETGFSSSTNVTKCLPKNLFLAIANPLYIFELSNGDRADLLIDWNYYDYIGDLADVLPNDLPQEVSVFLKNFGKLSLFNLRNKIRNLKDNIKANSSLKIAYDAQLDILANIPNMEDLIKDISAKNIAIQEEIQEAQAELRVIAYIEDELLKNAVQSINEGAMLTQFTESGEITFGNTPVNILSSGERLDCGLDIANVMASKHSFIPPTLIDNATANGHATIEKKFFPNLSQAITTSYANVDLCEYNSGYLRGLDKGWKVKALPNFRPEVEIEILSV